MKGKKGLKQLPPPKEVKYTTRNKGRNNDFNSFGGKKGVRVKDTTPQSGQVIKFGKRHKGASNMFISDNGETNTLKILDDGGGDSGGTVYVQPANPDTGVYPSTDPEIYNPPKDSPIISEVNIIEGVGIEPIEPPPPPIKDRTDMTEEIVDTNETLVTTTTKTKTIWLLLLLLLVIVAVYFLSKSKK